MASLEEDFERVSSELDAALAEQAVLAAKIEGLVAHRAALERALANAAVDQPRDQPRDLTALNKTAAIKEVLRSTGQPMRIREIVEALRAAGRAEEGYNTISIYLGNLVNDGVIERVQRGQYSLPRNSS